jgi:hypothetical protein
MKPYVDYMLWYLKVAFSFGNLALLIAWPSRYDRIWCLDGVQICMVIFLAES